MNTEPAQEAQGLLIIPHLRIQNANALSSPMTHGFPAMTAWLGLMWALQRKLAEAQIPLTLEKIGIICHWHEEQVQEGYVKTLRLRKPNVANLKQMRKFEEGSPPAIVEEGRIHLDVTLIFQVHGGDAGNANNPVFQDDAQRRAQAWQIRDLISTMRIAGGTVLPNRPTPGQFITPSLLAVPETADEREKQFRHLRRRWLPGFALVSRDDLLQQRVEQLQQQDPHATTLDAWLDLSRFNYRSHTDTQGKTTWKHDRPAGSGWMVPIPVGYGALSETYKAGQVTNARDQSTPFRFVESLYSIGQWISPHRLNDARDLLWYASSQPTQGLYRCCNDYKPPASVNHGPMPNSPLEPAHDATSTDAAFFSLTLPILNPIAD